MFKWLTRDVEKEINDRQRKLYEENEKKTEERRKEFEKEIENRRLLDMNHSLMETDKYITEIINKSDVPTIRLLKFLGVIKIIKPSLYYMAVETSNNELLKINSKNILNLALELGVVTEYELSEKYRIKEEQKRIKKDEEIRNFYHKIKNMKVEEIQNDN